MMLDIFLTEGAKQDIADLWFNGVEQFGQKVADDYDLLILQAITDLAEDPKRHGTRPVDQYADGLFAYPLEFSNKRKKIRKPSHAVFYFTVQDDTLVIAAVTRPGRERFLSQLDIDQMRRESKQ